MLNTSNKNTRKMIVIHGGHFSSLGGFYEEVSKVLMKDTDWNVGTLDGFDDILYGGFGVFENHEEIEILWKESEKSKQELGFSATREFYENKIKQGKPFNIKLIQQKLDDLISGKGPTLFDILVEIIESHTNINLTLS
ncbi:ribonuclease inhibitor [Chryseobacterium indologenes]|uniref:Ribonuclease inhibitor n=2 Tax=Chryseobacterium group TaxID=2782232 RepID=A0AAD0YUZ1_CHRID|nr:ribonuclease inhibitor [Chryseobacterium indologenes]AZB17391.1 ribonuclease inhibitor [Chryseobacterium indologenes]MBF6644005.1 ribonuclease inhibitor [Chryseobacterium indologenes]MBU3049784.1 ribonuclease inhibitor [Chryseobacterium indologenes]QQQ72269.1 ribonuclease inhibitor [Chryseobacterium indologenes]